MPVQDYSEIFGDDFQDTLDTLEEQFPDEIDTIIDETRDMEEGGKIFGFLRNSIKAAVVLGIAQSARFGQYEEFDMDQEFTWVTVSGHRICSDCQERAGTVLPFSDWEAIGLPGSGWSLCGSYCYCILDPNR